MFGVKRCQMAEQYGTDQRLAPQGELLRRALRWLDDRRREGIELPPARLVEEAAVRFNLTPWEEEFLLQNWGRER
jgi:hypothetical protein